MKNRLFALTTIATLTAAMAACSVVPARNTDLDRAQSRLQVAQRDPQVAQYAQPELKEASHTLDQAQKAWQNEEPQSTVSHLAYMGSQRVVIAEKRASALASQAVMANASAERDHMRLALRTAEADQAQQQLATAADANARKTAALAEADAAILREQARADSSDARARELSEQLQALNAKKTDRGYVVTLEDVLFNTGQANLMPQASGFLASLAEAFRRHDTLFASIEGHTDSVGSSSSNVVLSERRAQAVWTALLSLGVRSEQLNVHGFGESNPIANNGTVAGRQMNRRVEIVFAPQNGLILAK